MIVEARNDDLDRLVAGLPPIGFGLVPGNAIAPSETLAMLRDLAESIRPGFAPAAWLIVEQDEVVGLCSLVLPPEEGNLQIGYGVAEGRRGRGATTRAVAGLVRWACGDPRVDRLSAETNVANIASRRVLERNGFRRVGERIDAEDGDLICWSIETPATDPVTLRGSD